MDYSCDIDRIVEIISTVGNIPKVGHDDDFYAAGFSSFAALPLVLELEDAWGISIEDSEFVQARTARALHAVLSRLQRSEAKQ